LVQGLDYVILPEICALLQDHIDIYGDGYVALNGCTNVVIWDGCSEAFTEVISAALRLQKMFAWPSSKEAYGQYRVDLPLVKPLATMYAEPHWLPVCFRSVPFKAEEQDFDQAVEESTKVSILRTFLNRDDD